MEIAFVIKTTHYLWLSWHPPTTAASQSPARIDCTARCKAVSEDEQLEPFVFWVPKSIVQRKHNPTQCRSEPTALIKQLCQPGGGANNEINLPKRSRWYDILLATMQGIPANEPRASNSSYWGQHLLKFDYKGLPYRVCDWQNVEWITRCVTSNSLSTVVDSWIKES